jgi:hypothetical protein
MMCGQTMQIIAPHTQVRPRVLFGSFPFAYTALLPTAGALRGADNR